MRVCVWGLLTATSLSLSSVSRASSISTQSANEWKNEPAFVCRMSVYDLELWEEKEPCSGWLDNER